MKKGIILLDINDCVKKKGGNKGLPYVRYFYVTKDFIAKKCSPFVNEKRRPRVYVSIKVENKYYLISSFWFYRY